MGYYTDQEQKDIISNNLTYLIELSGKDQKQIAIELDVNPPTFNQWVNGKAVPNITTLRRIAEYFNRSLSEIVNPKNQKSEDEGELSAHEKQLIRAYQDANVTTKRAIDVLLNLRSGENGNS